MPIIVACPMCGTRLQAPDNAAGRHVKWVQLAILHVNIEVFAVETRFLRH